MSEAIFIAGDRHLTALEGQCGLETVVVPALRFRSFFEDRPVTMQLREALDRAGPRILSFGAQDVFDVCEAADGRDIQAKVEALLIDAEALFAAAEGASWLVFPQPPMRYPHLGPDEVRQAAQLVHRSLAERAAAQGWEVLDPFGVLHGGRTTWDEAVAQLTELFELPPWQGLIDPAVALVSAPRDPARLPRPAPPCPDVAEEACA